ncbi:MAG: universal stress protein [Desulfurococcaceae archaeon]|jgi:nucleotide-binding universal stress UspA family protein|nr:universal stress protein [Desulfurococcaceae archaeon]
MSYYREPTYLISFMFRRILVPIDGSASSLKALDIALDFAKRYGSKLTALIVNDKTINVEEVSGEISSKARKSGIEVVLKIKEIRNPNESVVSKVLEEISEGSYDLVILGARGRTLSEDLLIGSTALSVIINSPISCLVVR